MYEDILRLPEDDVRREIIGGELFVSPSPSGSHQDAAFEITVAFREYAAAHGGWYYTAPRDVFFGPQDVVVPDAVYSGRIAFLQSTSARSAERPRSWWRYFPSHRIAATGN